MIPYIAIAAGVTIGASILRCIFDELSSEEIERQEEIQKKRSEADASYKKYKSGLEASKRSHLDQISQDEAARTEAMQRENYFEMLSVVTEYCDELILSAQQQRDEKQALVKEIDDTIKSIKQAMKGQVTMLRRNSLLCLLRELEEAREKLRAYSACSASSSSPRSSQLFGTCAEPWIFIHPASEKRKGFWYFLTTSSMRSN